MKRLFALMLALCLLLCACGGTPEETTPPATDPTVTEAPTDAPTEAPTDPPTEPPTEAPTDPTEAPTEPAPELPYQNPITGERLAEAWLARPYAVAIDNDSKDATPHWGGGKADMIWELPHEGGSTRMVGVFCDVSDVDKLGPTRSVRPYVLSVAQCFNAILVHAGGSPQGYDLLDETDWDNLDGVQGPGAGSYYKRDKDRLNKVDSWHTMYITGSNVLKYTKKLGYKTTFSETPNYNLTFTEDATPDGETAETIKVRFQKSGKKTNFYYDAAAGAYTAEQFSAAYSDGNDGAVPYFENVLILKTSVSKLDDYGRLNVKMVGSGKGYFASGGKMVEINWSRDSANDSYTYTLADGTPLTLGIGKTYVAVIYKNGTVSAS